MNKYSQVDFTSNYKSNSNFSKEYYFTPLYFAKMNKKRALFK